MFLIGSVVKSYFLRYCGEVYLLNGLCKVVMFERYYVYLYFVCKMDYK